VVTNDSDTLTFGAEMIIFKIDLSTNTVECRTLASVLQVMGLTQDQFVDFCVFQRNDYNNQVAIDKIGPSHTLTGILRCGSGKAYLEELRGAGHKVTNLNFDRVRDIFTNFDDESELDNILSPEGPRNQEKINEFLKGDLFLPSGYLSHS
jgi:5'-3' exonuclease